MTNTEIIYYDNNSSKTIVSFTGIGKKIGLPTKEFYSLIQNNVNVLFVLDHSISFFSNLDIKKIKKNIKTDIVYTIGHSMGAYHAILFSMYHDIKKCLAMSAMFSPYVKYGGHREFQHFILKIKKPLFNEPFLRFNQKTEYLIVNGDDEMEKKQLTLMPDYDNIKKITIENCGHSVGKTLKNRNLLKPLINDFFNFYDQNN